MSEAPRSRRRRGALRLPAWFSAAGVVAACAAAAVASTWRLPLHFATALPLGTDRTATPPLFSLWNLWWVGDRVRHGFAGLWDAPIFHPAEAAFTFSEPLLFQGVVVAPLWLVGLSPAAIHNVALLMVLVLNGILAYRLARALELAGLACLFGAIVAVCLPFVGKHLGVVSVLPLFGVFWTLEGLVRFGRHPRARHGLWAGTGILALFLASQQLGLMFLPFAVAAGGFAVLSSRRPLRAAGRLAASALPFALIVVILARPGRIARAGQGFERSETVARALSATPEDFLLRPATALVPLPPPALPEHGDPAGLFPGVMLLLLATAGVGTGWRRPGVGGWTVLLAASAVAAAILALGLNVSLGDWRPFATLRAWLPELRQLRAPYRFAAITQASLVPLAAVGLAYLLERFGSRSALRPWVIAAGFLAAVESLTVPVPLQAVPRAAESEWTRWLQTQPPGTVTVHLPLPSGFHVSHYELEARRLFAQIAHGQPLVNGYSSFFPADYTRLQAEMAGEPPSPRLLCILYRLFEARLLAADRRWLERHAAEMSFPDVAAALVPVYAGPELAIYRLRPPPGCVEPRERLPQP